MKRLIGLILFVVIVLVLSSCKIDLEDDTHDDDYIKVSYYYEVDEETNEVSKVYYVSDMTFYHFDKDELENVFAIRELSYGSRGDWTVDFKEYFDVYAVKERQWVSIPETAWYESNQKLIDDVLTIYGTLPILSQHYDIGDTVRVSYLENNLLLHFMVQRVDGSFYVRYGDLREMVLS